MLYLRTADRALYADLSAALAMARYLERRGCRQRRRHHRVATGDGVDRADLIRANAAHPGRAPVTRRMPAKVRIAKLRSEEHTSELQSLMRISYAVFCLKKKNKHQHKPKSKIKEIKRDNKRRNHTYSSELQ